MGLVALGTHTQGWGHIQGFGRGRKRVEIPRRKGELGASRSCKRDFPAGFGLLPLSCSAWGTESPPLQGDLGDRQSPIVAQAPQSVPGCQRGTKSFWDIFRVGF